MRAKPFLVGELELARHEIRDTPPGTEDARRGAVLLTVAIVATVTTEIEELAPSGATFAHPKLTRPRVEIVADPDVFGKSGTLELEDFDVARALWHTLGEALASYDLVEPAADLDVDAQAAGS